MNRILAFATCCLAFLPACNGNREAPVPAEAIETLEVTGGLRMSKHDYVMGEEVSLEVELNNPFDYEVILYNIIPDGRYDYHNKTVSILFTGRQVNDRKYAPTSSQGVLLEKRLLPRSVNVISVDLRINHELTEPGLYEATIRYEIQYKKYDKQKYFI